MVLWTSRLLLLLLYGASVCFSAAIPVISLEQVTGGNKACTSARRQVLSALRATSRELTRISAISARNQTIRTSARQALTGMRDATTGIAQVASSLLAGDEPTQASRDRVERGFGSVKSALDSMTGVQNANIARRVTRAKSSLNKAIAARDKLVVECQGSSASTSTIAASTTAGTVETILTDSVSSEAVSSTSSSETAATSVSLTRTTIILTAETSPPLPTDTVASTTESEGAPAPTETVEESPLPPLSILTLTGSAASTISSTDVISPTPVAVVSDSTETFAASAPQA